MNCILEQVCKLAIWVKSEIKNNKNVKFPYSYEDHHINKITFLTCQKPGLENITGGLINNPSEWLEYLKNNNIVDIKIDSSIEEKNHCNLMMPEKQKISIICVFEKYATKYSAIWGHNKGLWEVQYVENPYPSFYSKAYKDNTEDLKNIICRIIDYYSTSNYFSKEFNEILEIFSDKNYNNFLKMTPNDNLYLAASKTDNLYCGMGNWFDNCQSAEELQLGQELYKQARLAILYCVNEI